MKKIVSLMYHDVFDLSITESGFQDIGALKYKISRQSFEDQIKVIDAYCIQQLIDKENIYLTFDDGGKSFLTMVAPILEKYGFKGYFFITTKLIDSFGFLTAEDIIELDHRGHVIGTHSHSHPRNISSLGKQEIEHEWVESIKILKGILKKPVKFASIPGGFYSSDSKKVLFSNDVNVIFTSLPTTSIKFLDLKMIIGRYSVTQGMSYKEFADILKPFSMIRLKQRLKWEMLRISKMILGRHYYTLREILFQAK